MLAKNRATARATHRDTPPELGHLGATCSNSIMLAQHSPIARRLRLAVRTVGASSRDGHEVPALCPTATNVGLARPFGVGSIIRRTSVTLVAGNPLSSACFLMICSSLARYTQKVLFSAT